MPYKYANNATTTLNGSVTPGQTTITVASASGFPSSGNFTIRIDSEILLVTGVAGTTWTVARGEEGTAAASHSNGASVTQILTAKPLNRLSMPGTIRAIRATSNQSIPNNTDTVVVFNSIVREDDDENHLSLNTNTGVITVSETGWYLITAGLRWASNSTGQRAFGIRVDGTEHARSRKQALNESESEVSTIIYLTAGQTVSVVCVQTSGGSLDIQADNRTFLCLHYLRG